MSFQFATLAAGMTCGTFSLFAAQKGFVHGITGRQGGVSKVPYDSLDMALHVGDDAEAVIENRRRFFAALGLDANRLVTPNQVHGDHIEVVTEREAGRGAKAYDDSISETDALITNTPNLPLMLCYADCTPILFLDPVQRAIGIAHGGWKGTVARIAQKTAERMQQEFGTKPENLLAAIGPSIGPCCFEVGEEVADKFREAFPGHEAELIDESGQKPHVSLWQANRLQLLEAGLLPEHIELANYCTSCHHDQLFSYRADGGKTGRLAAILAIKD